LLLKSPTTSKLSLLMSVEKLEVISVGTSCE